VTAGLSGRSGIINSAMWEWFRQTAKPAGPSLTQRQRGVESPLSSPPCHRPTRQPREPCACANSTPSGAGALFFVQAEDALDRGYARSVAFRQPWRGRLWLPSFRMWINRSLSVMPDPYRQINDAVCNSLSMSVAEGGRVSLRIRAMKSRSPGPKQVPPKGMLTSGMTVER
jgi:hypothetical protein